MLIFAAVTLMLTFVVMLIEQRLVPPRKPDDVPDLRERSVGIYFLLALFSSAIILPIYFYVRRGPIGIAIGFAFTIVVAIVSAIVSTRLTLLFASA
jgi:hypothetical protein